VLLRGTWVPIDPRAWISRFSVKVRDGAGHMAQNQRLQILGAIATQQKEILQTLGPNNPLCTLGQLRNTLADMAECAGIDNPGRYFNALPPNYQVPPPPPPAPTPEDILAQSEAQKAAADSVTERARAQTERLEALLEDDRLRDQETTKAVLQAADLSGKYGITLDVGALARLLQRNPIGPVATALQAPLPPVPPAPPPGAPPGTSAPQGTRAVGVPGVGPPGLGATAVPGAPRPPPPGPPAQPGLGLVQGFLPAPVIAALSGANRGSVAPPMPQAAPMPAMPPRPAPMAPRMM
jgi:hypothetical protein